MELTLRGLRNAGWQEAGIRLPSHDPARTSLAGRRHPVWVHFGIGNIFRVFPAGIAEELLECGAAEQGITAVEAFDFEIVDRIYRPFDNLILSVILHEDGREDKRVLGSVSETLKGSAAFPEDWRRLREVFSSPSLQMVSFTVTEKGYALRDSAGELLPQARRDLEQGPGAPGLLIGIVTALLLDRFRAGGAPLALVSMDNCSRNGELLRKAVMTVARAWVERSFAPDAFFQYVQDEGRVAFPWTMIDKITPRPSEQVAARLRDAGLRDMDPVLTAKRTYIAPFVNAEDPRYLVIEDHFPNGRPALERAKGVYLTDRDTVNRAERMKVTACLNPIHTALGPYGVVLGYDLFSDEMKDPDLLQLARRVGYTEGLPVAPDPGILSPRAFLDECMQHRFPNPCLGDTCLRLCTDASQGLGVRFGVTIRAYTQRDGDARALRGISLAIAGWLRYMLGVDDEGKPYERAPDPLNEEIAALLRSVRFGHPESVTDRLRALLSNENIFYVNLDEVGLAEEILRLLRAEIAGPGAVRATLRSEIASWSPGASGAAGSIRRVEENKKQYLPLLLLADEQESMIDRYLERGTMYILEKDGIAKAECLVTDEGDGILEIKSLAVAPEHQKKGYGRSMLRFVAEKYRDSFTTLQVGTGDSPLTLPFYERCGFVRHHTIRNFFTDNYDHPILEDGQPLRDMVILRMPL